MKPILIILNGDRAGERLILEDGKRYILGRDRSADITLEEKKISRRHACLYWDKGTKDVVIEDLGSLNGTMVNGESISGAVKLSNGDRIQVGSFLLKIDMHDVSAVSIDPVQTDKRYKSTPSIEESFEPIEPVSQSASEVDSKTGGRLIHGKLDEISLSDLLQMLATTKKTGRLILSDSKVDRPLNPRSADESVGFIFMREGDVENAIVKGMEGEEAFYECMKRGSGYFALYPLDAKSEHRAVMTTPIEALLLEAFRRIDEEKAQNRTKLSPNDQFEVNPEEPLGTLSPVELQVFQSVWKHKKFAVILDNSPLSREETEDAIKKLMRGGFIKKKKTS